MDKNKKELPIDVIDRWLKDSNCNVRTAAMNACKANKITVPVIRTIDPPNLVYKKCIGGIIVVASIPKDAQIRGSFNEKCRASKAEIKKIIGDLHGEKVGISKYDMKTLYYAGDKVEIENFDYSDDECSSGFHFFCTIKEAIDYE